MVPKQRDVQQNRIDVTKVKAIKVVKPEPEGRARPRLGTRLLVAGLSALLAASVLIANDADAKGKKHKEKPVAAEVVTVDAGITEVAPAEAAPQPAEEAPAQPAEEADAGVAPGNPAANGQTEDEFFSGVISDLRNPWPDAGTEETGEAPKTEGGNIVTTNLVFPVLPKRLSEYEDTGVSQTSDRLDISGKARGISLENNFDLGLNIVGNEAGNAVFGSFRYRDLARVDAGAIAFFGNQLVPFARLGISPYVNIWNFKLEYYGTVASLGNLPSYLYSSHSVGLTYSQPIGENFRLRMSGIVGGALSYPTWDDTYFNLSAGLSMEIYKMLLIYGVPSFYFAADDPIKTAYVGYYKPKFQDVEVGAQVALREYTIRAFADIGLIGDNYGIYNKYGFRGTRTFRATDSVEVDVWASLGFTQWSQQLSGRFDPLVMAGLTVVIGGGGINSTNTVNYSHMEDMTWEQAKVDKPTSANPGPYAFGHSGDPAWDVPINETKARILSSGSFDEFANSYGGSLSEDEVILRARFLGAFMARVAYANKAQEDLTTGKPTSEEADRVGSANSELIFDYLQRYVAWYSGHGSNSALPEDLSNGIALCAGIHQVMAEFMIANGVDAVMKQVSTPDGMHVIAIAQLKGRAVLIDYGNTLEASDVDHAVELYGQMNGARTFVSQTFAPDDNGKIRYIGTELTPAGRLLHGTVGLDNQDITKKDLGAR